MSSESVREYLAARGRDADILVATNSTATVREAADAFGVEPARIAKTLAFRGAEPDTCFLVVAAGDARISNSEFRSRFGVKAKMLRAEEVQSLTGHPVGGVCPFANPPVAQKFLDESLLRFKTVFPACGSANSAIELTPEELFDLAEASDWVSVTQQPDVNA